MSTPLFRDGVLTPVFRAAGAEVSDTADTVIELRYRSGRRRHHFEASRRSAGERDRTSKDLAAHRDPKTQPRPPAPQSAHAVGHRLFEASRRGAGERDRTSKDLAAHRYPKLSRVRRRRRARTLSDTASSKRRDEVRARGIEPPRTLRPTGTQKLSRVRRRRRARTLSDTASSKRRDEMRARGIEPPRTLRPTGTRKLSRVCRRRRARTLSDTASSKRRDEVRARGIEPPRTLATHRDPKTQPRLPAPQSAHAVGHRLFEASRRGAGERDRTSKDLAAHRDLNPARLPVPPRPRGSDTA